MKHKQLYLLVVYILSLGLLTACSNDEDNSPNQTDINSGSHSYYISLDNGEEFQGSVPKYTGDIFYYSAFVEYNEDTNRDNLSILLYETGIFNLSIVLELDEDNQPNPESNFAGISFNEWNAEKIYTSIQYTAKLDNYQEQTVNHYGENAKIAAFTLHFEGTFSNTLNNEIVSGSGTIIIAAP